MDGLNIYYEAFFMQKEKEDMFFMSILTSGQRCIK